MSAMEEWQRRQRAEKEAARKKKTESAELLRGYRGGVNDEELKLRTLREEERRKTMDAQQHLHNYKGMNEEELKLRTKRDEERRKTMEAEQNLHNYKGAGGVNEEDLKLRTLREEERRKTMDAQQNLHQYNGTAAVEQLQQQPKKKPTGTDAVHPVPVNAGVASSKDHLAGVDFGSVSDRAAALAAAAEAAGQIPSPTATYSAGGGSKPTVSATKEATGPSETTLPSVPAIHDESASATVEESLVVNSSPVENETTEAIATEIDKKETEGSPPVATADSVLADEKKEAFPSEEALDAVAGLPEATEIARETPVAVAPQLEDEPSTMKEDSLPTAPTVSDTKLEPPTSSEPHKTAAPQAPVELPSSSEKKETSTGVSSNVDTSKGGALEPAVVQSTTATTSKENETTPSLTLDRAVVDSAPTASSLSPVVTTPTNNTTSSPVNSPTSPQTPPGAGPKTRVNVLFSFGVVSVQDNPDLFGYMAAVEKVVRALLQKKQQDCEGITFDSKLRPFVKKTNNDPSFQPDDKSRSDIKRTLVTAAVPIFFRAPATKASTKKAVVDALQASIQSGHFLKMALALTNSNA